LGSSIKFSPSATENVYQLMAFQKKTGFREVAPLFEFHAGIVFDGLKTRDDNREVDFLSME